MPVPRLRARRPRTGQALRRRAPCLGRPSPWVLTVVWRACAGASANWAAARRAPPSAGSWDRDGRRRVLALRRVRALCLSDRGACTRTLRPGSLGSRRMFGRSPQGGWGQVWRVWRQDGGDGSCQAAAGAPPPPCRSCLRRPLPDCLCLSACLPAGQPACLPACLPNWNDLNTYECMSLSFARRAAVLWGVRCLCPGSCALLGRRGRAVGAVGAAACWIVHTARGACLLPAAHQAPSPVCLYPLPPHQRPRPLPCRGCRSSCILEHCRILYRCMNTSTRRAAWPRPPSS